MGPLLFIAEKPSLAAAIAEGLGNARKLAGYFECDNDNLVTWCFATGSYNFTESAQKSNAENLLFIDDKKTAQEYVDNWGWHWAHSMKVVE